MGKDFTGFAIRLEQERLDQLKELAKVRDHTFSDEVREAIDNHLRLHGDLLV